MFTLIWVLEWSVCFVLFRFLLVVYCYFDLDFVTLFLLFCLISLFSDLLNCFQMFGLALRAGLFVYGFEC